MASSAPYPIFPGNSAGLCLNGPALDSNGWVCDPAAVYRPRNLKASDFYACVEDNFEELERVYDERYTTRVDMLL